MRIPLIISAYVGRQYLIAFVAILAGFLVVIMLADVIELLRRVAGRPEIGFATVIKLALLKLPFLGQKTFPFAGLFAAMVLFWRFARSHELTVIRAAGVSVWKFLAPTLVLAFLLGVLQITLTNPLAATLLSRYERLEGLLLERHLTTLAMSDSGLWLRQAGEAGQSVIHATHVLQDGNRVELRNVSVFNYQGKDRFVGRYDAAFASLEDGYWRLRDVWILIPEQPKRFEPEFLLATDLTLARIQDSFAPPQTISFWQLPEFIRTLQSAGFSAVAHRLQFQTLLSAPLLMCAMVLIAAAFAPRHGRRSGTMYMIGGGVLAGFILYFVSDLVFAVGLSDQVPVALAAWTPAMVATMLGLATLLHLENG